MRGSEVQIYVGPEKKCYYVPKKLLCESSHYFERRLDGNNSKDRKEHKLWLETDPVNYFEFILEYMMIGKIAKDAIQVADLKAAVEFIEYAEKYELKGASDGVHDGLRSALTTDPYTTTAAPISQADIESVFKGTLPGSPLRMLIVQAALSFKGLRGIKEYSKLEATVEGYAYELVVQMRACLECMDSLTYTDPLRGSNKSCK